MKWVRSQTGRSGRGRHVTAARAMLAAVATAWIPLATARADEPLDLGAVEDVQEISLETLLDLPVVGASRYQQLASQAPSSVSVITAEDIKSFGYRTIADVLQGERGFYVTNDRSLTYVGVRGFGIPGDYNSRVLLLVDGHRINDGVYSMATIANDSPIDLDDVARIELIRGPGSSVYGSNAFFAVINVITKRGVDLRGARASVETSFLDDTHDTPAGAGTRAFTGGRFSLAWGDVFGGLDLVATASYSKSAGVPRLYFPELDGNPGVTCSDAAHQEIACDGMSADLDSEEVWRARLQASYRGFTLQAVYGRRRKDIPTATFGTIFGDDGEGMTTGSAYADLAYSTTRGPYALSTRAYFDSNHYEGTFPFDGRQSAEESLTDNRAVETDVTREKAVGVEAQLVATVAAHGALSGGRVSVGAEARHMLEGTLGATAGPVVLLDSHGTESYVGLYAQAEATLASRLQLSAGLRLDHYVSSFGSALNPRLAAIYTPVAGTRFKLLYGTAFRAPNTFEREYYAAPPGAVVLNPDLGPEHITTVEGVAEQYLNEKIRATVSIYRYAATDLIRTVPFGDEGATQFQNGAAVTTQGVELELEGKWGTSRARVSYAWQRAADADTGMRLVNSPRSQFKLNLIVPLIARRLTLGLESQYMSVRQGTQGGDAPPYFLSHVTLVSEELLRGLTLSLSVKNLFDEKYADPGSLTHIQTTIRQDPRTLWLKAAYTY